MEINIFRAGEQTSSTGNKREFTEKDLDQVVESYNQEIHEAPVRIGHEDNSDKTPAWGWVKDLKRKGYDLFAEIEFVPQMLQFIEDKLYKKVSSSFYHPESDVNPHKGKWSLRHVAVLGAEPPAVKGLKGFAYSEEEDFINCSEVDLEVKEEKEVIKLMESNPELGPTLIEEDLPMTQLKEELQEAIKVAEEEVAAEEIAPTTTPEPESEAEEVESTSDDPEEFKEKPSPPSEPEPEPDEDEDEEELDEEDEEEEFSDSDKKKSKKEEYSETPSVDWELKYRESQAKVIKLEAEIRRGLIEDFLEGIYDSGKLTEDIFPEEELLEYMEKIDSGSMDFAEGEGPLTPIMKILERLPEAVSYAEFAKDSDFSEEEAEETELSPHDRALKLVESEGLDYTEALKKAIYYN